MALEFDSGSSEGLLGSSTPVTAAPLTLACWAYLNNITAQHSLVAIPRSNNSIDYFTLDAAGNVGGDPLHATARDSGTSASAATSAGYSASTWFHAAAVFASATSRTVYLDGGSSGSNATSIVPASLDRVSVGYLGRSSPVNYADGLIAEVGIWNAALAAADIARLASGFSPVLIRPDALVAYYPLLDVTDPQLTRVGTGPSLAFTNTPTLGSHHPTVYYPTGTPSLNM